MNRTIYLDNAATTPMHPEVLEAMSPYFTESYGNPASIYSFAGKSRRAVTGARETIAGLLGAKTEEIYFTGGGSESDNWALKAVAESCGGGSPHIITTKIEHHAILHTCAYLERKGCRVTCLDVDCEGRVDPAAVEAAIAEDTVLISVMMANNEVGTIQPIAQIGAIAKKHGVLFHTDAVQAFGHLEIDVDALGVDLLSASAHKLGGPKGVGLLYARNNVKLAPFIHGGSQERARRAGTLNVPGIVGFGKAAQLAGENMTGHGEYESGLCNYLQNRVLGEIPGSRWNGPSGDGERLPNNASFCFEDIQGESLLIQLDQRGICASSGSACTSGALEPSHVLLAMGVGEELARGSLRITLSERNTYQEMDYLVESLKEIIGRLRRIKLSV